MNNKTKATETEEAKGKPAPRRDPLFDIFDAEDEEGNVIPEADVIALSNEPIVIKIKIGNAMHKLALEMGNVDMATWLADDTYRRDFYLKRGSVNSNEDDDPETALQNAHAQDEITLDVKRWELRAALVIAALARDDKGTVFTSIKELREAPTVQTLMEPRAFNRWGRRLINAACTEIDSFFTS